MGRLIKACGQTVDNDSDGTVTTPCDCECEGCCCQHLIFSTDSGKITIDADWITFNGDLLTCLLGTQTYIYITDVRVWIDFCPPFPNYLVVTEDYLYSYPAYGTPIEVTGLSNNDCITIILYDQNGNELSRCTAKITGI